MILHYLLDFIFPIHCIGCNRWNEWLCANCLLKAINPGKLNFPTEALDTVYYLGQYQNPLLQQAIHQFKYQQIKGLGVILGKTLGKQLSLSNDTLVIPIPLHPRRQRERGFNQSVVLAEQFGLPVKTALQRVYYTTPQATLNRAQRLTNAYRAFMIQPNYTDMLPGSNVLLVDDVFTTGTTLTTCAKLLRQAGVSQIAAAVIAID